MVRERDADLLQRLDLRQRQPVGEPGDGHLHRARGAGALRARGQGRRSRRDARDDRAAAACRGVAPAAGGGAHRGRRAAARAAARQLGRAGPRGPRGRARGRGRAARDGRRRLRQGRAQGGRRGARRRRRQGRRRCRPQRRRTRHPARAPACVRPHAHREGHGAQPRARVRRARRAARGRGLRARPAVGVDPGGARRRGQHRRRGEAAARRREGADLGAPGGRGPRRGRAQAGARGAGRGAGRARRRQRRARADRVRTGRARLLRRARVLGGLPRADGPALDRAARLRRPARLAARRRPPRARRRAHRPLRRRPRPLPDQRVVEVLEAVHLLLALDLFVVVVGVDPRWLLGSLEHHFEAQFAPRGNRPGRLRWRTTPQDFLEKIARSRSACARWTAAASSGWSASCCRCRSGRCPWRARPR